MSKNKWDEILHEEVSEELKHRTMVRVRQELEALQEESSWNFLKFLVPAVSGLTAMVLVFRFWQQGEDGSPPQVADNEDLDFLFEVAELVGDNEDEFDLDLIEDMELLEDLEVLEAWDGRDEA